MRNKIKELNRAKRVIKKFCIINKIPIVIIRIKNDLDGLGCYPNGSRNIYINLELTTITSSRNNPAMIRENTITGTIIHEFAHYIHITTRRRILNNHFKKLKEPLINYWETDVEEDIAESIRLFILNPFLLKEGRPKRYNILSRYFEPIKNVKHYSELFKGLNRQKRRAVNMWIKGVI